MMQLTLLIRGDISLVFADPQEQVETLKERIASKFALDQDLIKLRLNEEEIGEKGTLLELTISEDSVIEVVLLAQPADSILKD